MDREKAKSEAFYCIIRSIYYLRPKKSSIFTVQFLINAIQILEQLADEIHKENYDIERIKNLVEKEKKFIGSTDNDQIMQKYFTPRIELLDKIVSLMSQIDTN